MAASSTNICVAFREGDILKIKLECRLIQRSHFAAEFNKIKEHVTQFPSMKMSTAQAAFIFTNKMSGDFVAAFYCTEACIKEYLDACNNYTRVYAGESLQKRETTISM